MTRKILFLLYSLSVTQAYAGVSIIDGNISIQNVSVPELYVFCNQKDTTLILDRVEFDSPGAQAGWSSFLPPHMCSIFLTDKSPFTFACRQETSDIFNTLDCKDVLLASRLPWGGQTLNRQPIAGSYWILENATPDELIIMLRHKNIDT